MEYRWPVKFSFHALFVYENVNILISLEMSMKFEKQKQDNLATSPYWKTETTFNWRTFGKNITKYIDPLHQMR